MPHLLDRRGDELRQALAAELDRLGEPVPAVLDVARVGVLEAGRRTHLAVGKQLASLAISARVERVENLGRELRGLLEDGRHRVGRRVLESRKLRDVRKPRELVQYERHVLEGGVVGAHGRIGSGWPKAIAYPIRQSCIPASRRPSNSGSYPWRSAAGCIQFRIAPIERAPGTSAPKSASAALAF